MYKYILYIFTCIIAISCGRADRLLEQIDEMINQVELSRRAVLTDSRRWKTHIEDLQNNVSEDVSNIIRDDLNDVAQSVTESVGIEIRCEIDFVESKIIGYLDGVLKALKQIRQKAEDEGRLDASIETLLSNMIDSRKLISPWPCHVDDDLNFIKVGNTLALKENEEAKIVGFALRRPLNEYTVSLINKDFEVVDSISGEKCLSDPTSYILKVLTDKLPLNNEHQFIKVTWNNTKLSEMEINVERQENPTSNRQFAALIIYIHSRTEKNQRISLNVKFLKNNSELHQITELGRNYRFPSATEEEIRWIVESDFNENDFFSVQIKMEKLGHKGIEVDRKPVTMSSINSLLERKGYIKENNHYILYEYPPTLLDDWQGDIGFKLAFKDRVVEFRKIPFNFENGYVDNGTNSVFTAEWGADGSPNL